MILIAVAYQKALGEKNMENSTETRLRDYTRKYTEQSQFQARLLSDLSRDKWYVFLFPTFERTLSDVRENARLTFLNTRKDKELRHFHKTMYVESFSFFSLTLLTVVSRYSPSYQVTHSYHIHLYPLIIIIRNHQFPHA